MAKITDIKYELNGTWRTVPLTCNVKGEFIIKLPEDVYKALDLREKIEGSTAEGVKKIFTDALNRYKNAVTTQELLIAIRYQACGVFANDKEGKRLFVNHVSGKYNMEIGWSGRKSNGLAFTYIVCIKETVDTVTKWYYAKRGKEFPRFDRYKEQDANPEKYFKDDDHGDFRDPQYKDSSWKLIPYSDEAIRSLQNAEEKIRSVSEMLFNFIEKEPDEIFLTLTQNKLLPQ